MKYRHHAGFDKVPLDETNAREEWKPDPLSALDIPASDFQAWITATDAPQDLRELGPSVCAWQIRQKSCPELLPPERWPGRQVESDESKGFVAAVAGVLDRIPVESRVTIVARQDWIRNALNGLLDEWDRNGELEGKKRRRPYWRIWRHVRDRIGALSPDRTAVNAMPPDAEGELIIKRLKEWAREIRPRLDQVR